MTRAATSASRMISPPRIRKSLRRCRTLFIKEAIANHVLPIDDRTVERFDAKVAGRPDLMGGRTSLTRLSRHERMENAVY